MDNHEQDDLNEVYVSLSSFFDNLEFNFEPDHKEWADCISDPHQSLEHPTPVTGINVQPPLQLPVEVLDIPAVQVRQPEILPQKFSPIDSHGQFQCENVNFGSMKEHNFGQDSPSHSFINFDSEPDPIEWVDPHQLPEYPGLDTGINVQPPPVEVSNNSSAKDNTLSNPNALMTGRGLLDNRYPTISTAQVHAPLEFSPISSNVIPWSMDMNNVVSNLQPDNQALHFGNQQLQECHIQLVTENRIELSPSPPVVIHMDAFYKDLFYPAAMPVSGVQFRSSEISPMSKGKKVSRWSEEEHELFLRGLKVYKKGKWTKIAKEFVKTRSPAQIASHAQKYFDRQKEAFNTTTETSRKKRKSIHDMTIDERLCGTQRPPDNHPI